MPQLNPAPWLMVLIFSWFIFLTLIPPKILAHIYPNEPSPRDTKTFETKPWNWPWH